MPRVYDETFIKIMAGYTLFLLLRIALTGVHACSYQLGRLIIQMFPNNSFKFLYFFKQVNILLL